MRSPAMPRRLAAATVLLLLSGAPASANEFERVPPVTNDDTRKECGECHMAFQPGLLPAGSWTRIMDGLDDHFGEKASLPPGPAAEIRAYLTGNAAGRGDPALLRITEQRWWLREHGFRPEVWLRKDVLSKANCEACHRDAARGLYDD
ncbi:cytochrome C [Azospirillum brasilense]|nr:cytochrome C [Azospirillum brasilense]NUB35263.1 cytochrome C [Azospirillum brasilense]RIW04604.1 cytochrome C [Azospirillum brasilense]